MRFLRKKWVLFILIFLGIAFLGTLILTGFANIYAKSSDSLLNNGTFLSFAFFFIWLIIPACIAYYFTYKNYPKNVEENLSKKFESINAFKGVGMVLISILVLGVLFKLIISRGGFDPYTLISVTDGQLNSSVPSPSLKPQSLVLDFSALESESIKPKSEIDTSNWNQFEDKLIKVRFLYPSAWGTPSTSFNRGETGWFYRAYFSNSSFTFGGTGPDFSAGREGSLADFNGFSQQGHRFFWDSAETLCQSKDFVSCRISDKKVFVTSGAADCGHSIWGSGARVLLIDRPGEQISGLAFGESFLSTAYSSTTQALCQVDDQSSKEKFNKLIKERRLDVESIKKLDTVDKVFETITLL